MDTNKRGLAPTLPEFLRACISEDEENARSFLDLFPNGDLAPLLRRVLAECGATRRIVERLAQAEWLCKANAEAYSAAMRSHPLDQSRITALKTHGWELAGRRDGLRYAVDEVATVYADRPGYREGWRP